MLICWAVGIWDKMVLRWRRKGVGLRGFQHEMELTDDSEDDDFLKAFRKQKVYAAIGEAFKQVLSMVSSADARWQYHRILKKYREAKVQTATNVEGVSLTFFRLPNFEIYCRVNLEVQVKKRRQLIYKMLPIWILRICMCLQWSDTNPWNGFPICKCKIT